MRIAVNTRLLLPGKLEGIGWFTFETMRRIVRRFPEHEFHFLFDRPYSKEFLFAENVIPHVVPPPVRHPFLSTIWYDFSVPFVLRKIKPSLFVSPDCYTSLRTSVPQLTVIHDINFEHYPEDVPPVYTRYLKKRSPLFVRKSTRIATVSEFSKMDIIDHYAVPPGKIDVIYNGVNEAFREHTPEEKMIIRKRYSSGEDYFVFVGSIHPRKNLQRLLPAFDRYKDATMKATRLIVVGEPFWINKEVRAAMDQMKYRHHVVFTGRLGIEELSGVVGASMAMVYPSYFEGFGIPVIEGFRSCVPVITSNVSSLPEIAGDAALLCEPFSIDSISDAMISVDADIALRQSLIEKGRVRVKRYSWDNAASALWESMLKTISDGEA